MHGSFSMMVNFHALRLWIERTALKQLKRSENSKERISANGFMETTRQMEGFKCAALYLGGKKDDFVQVSTCFVVEGEVQLIGYVAALGFTWLQTRLAWKDSIVEFSPEDFSALQRKIREEVGFISLLLWSGYQPANKA